MPAPCWQAQCNQHPFLLLLVGCWVTTSWRNYHQQISVTTLSWYGCKFWVCLIFVRNASNTSCIGINISRYEQWCQGSKMKSAKRKEYSIFVNWNSFPLKLYWGRGVGQVHLWTPPSCPYVTSLFSLLPNTTCYSHLSMFKFSLLYKLSKKTCEV